MAFVRAQSDNLPVVDSFMLMEFMKTNDCFNQNEIRGVKEEWSMRGSYIESAVGYVQLKREGNTCTITGEICPEHRIRTKNYKVNMIVDEDREVIEIVKCFDCSAAEGGCKHALAFLMWVHKKSTQPSPTSVECYWKKPKLSAATLTIIKTDNFGISPHINSSAYAGFLDAVVSEGKSNNQLLKYFKNFSPINDKSFLGLHKLLGEFQRCGGETYIHFLSFAEKMITNEICSMIVEETKNQSACHEWYELRYGRITASKVYDAIHCHKDDGSFVNGVLGAQKLTETKSIKRGKVLEASVKKELERKLGKKIQEVGLMLNGKYPELGASPDGILVIAVFDPYTNKSTDECTNISDSCENLSNNSDNSEVNSLKFSCETCGKLFLDELNFINHKNEHSVITKLVCNICGKRFTRHSSVKRHMTTHTGLKPYSCPYCTRNFTQSGTLSLHLKIHKKYNSTKKVRQKTEDNLYLCSTCGKSFKLSSSLTIHLRRHSGERPYSCKICNKRFISNSRLTSHSRIHSGEKPYLCTYCQKSFSRSTTLNKHIKIHSDTKSYQCNHCPKLFSSSYYRNIYIRKHTGEKPLSCNICQKSFSDPKNFKEHKAIHNGDKSFLCVTCGKKFRRIHHLRVHMTMHTKS